MLVGGFTYLLFQAEADKLNLERELLQFGRFDNEDKLAREMSELWKSDMTSDPKRVDTLVAVVKRLAKNVTATRLDSAFAGETLSWTRTSISHIFTQVGRINGYTFSEELYKNLQQDYVKQLEAEKVVFYEVTGIVDEWNKTEVVSRRERLLQVANKTLEVRTALAQIVSRSHQVLEKLTEKMAENTQRYNELKNQNTIVARKKMFAIAGVSVGSLLVLLTIAVYSFKRLL